MTQVDFSVLETADRGDRFQLCCRLAEKAWSQGHRILVHCASAEDAERVDRLLWVSRGVLVGKRWAFTPILFTQLIFGAVEISVFGAADTVAKIVWALVVVYAVVVLRLLFSGEVRQHLVYSSAD